MNQCEIQCPLPSSTPVLLGMNNEFRVRVGATAASGQSVDAVFAQCFNGSGNPIGTEEQLTQVGTSSVWAGNIFGQQATFSIRARATFVDGQGNPSGEETDGKGSYTGDPNTGSTCP